MATWKRDEEGTFRRMAMPTVVTGGLLGLLSSLLPFLFHLFLPPPSHLKAVCGQPCAFVKKRGRSFPPLLFCMRVALWNVFAHPPPGLRIGWGAELAAVVVLPLALSHTAVGVSHLL